MWSWRGCSSVWYHSSVCRTCQIFLHWNWSHTCTVSPGARSLMAQVINQAHWSSNSRFRLFLKWVRVNIFCSLNALMLWFSMIIICSYSEMQILWQWPTVNHQKTCSPVGARWEADITERCCSSLIISEKQSPARSSLFVSIEEPSTLTLDLKMSFGVNDSCFSAQCVRVLFLFTLSLVFA